MATKAPNAPNIYDQMFGRNIQDTYMATKAPNVHNIYDQASGRKYNGYLHGHEKP